MRAEGKREQPPPENVSSALLYQIQTIYDLIWMLEFFLTACLVPLSLSLCLNEAGIFFPYYIYIVYSLPSGGFSSAGTLSSCASPSTDTLILLLTIKWKSTHHHARLVPLQGPHCVWVNALLHPLPSIYLSVCIRACFFVVKINFINKQKNLIILI